MSSWRSPVVSKSIGRIPSQNGAKTINADVPLADALDSHGPIAAAIGVIKENRVCSGGIYSDSHNPWLGFFGQSRLRSNVSKRSAPRSSSSRARPGRFPTFGKGLIDAATDDRVRESVRPLAQRSSGDAFVRPPERSGRKCRSTGLDENDVIGGGHRCVQATDCLSTTGITIAVSDVSAPRDEFYSSNLEREIM
jgi:hypothetical protein